MPLLENSPKIDMNSIDTFFLNLMLNYPFNDTEWKSKVPRVLELFQDENFRRYRYLLLLVDPIDLGEIEVPKASESTLIFLERLRSKHMKQKELRPSSD